MTDATLSALLARVEAATGPDREIDLSLAALAYPKTPRSYWADHTGHGAQEEYTASVDAALALIERVLPGWTVGEIKQSRFGSDPRLRWRAALFTPEHEEAVDAALFKYVMRSDEVLAVLRTHEHKGLHTLLPHALLAAMLRALIAKGAQDE